VARDLGLKALAQYAVECQSSYERGAARDFFSPGVCFLRCHAESGRGRKARRRRGLTPPCVAMEGRQAMDSDSPGRSRPFSLLSHSVPGTRRFA